MRRDTLVDQSMEALARDVSFLGRVLGDVLREQGGSELFDAVEALRLACRRARSQPSPEASERVAALVDALPRRLEHGVVRAFTMYFHLINMAEENHRLRRIALREAETYPAPRYESIGAAIARLSADGMTAQEMQKLVDGLHIRPVFTAHPTEARRMTILRGLRRVSNVVSALSRDWLSPSEREDLTRQLYADVTNLWQTNELRGRQQTVLDEVRNGLYYFDASLFDVVPAIYRDLESALARTYPTVVSPKRFLTFGSWIGGDRDGNPNVTADTTERTLRMQKALVLARYLDDVDELLFQITPSDDLTTISPELQRSIQQDVQTFGDVGRAIVDRYPDEPYRQKLTFVHRRLEATYAKNGVRWTGGRLDFTKSDAPTFEHASDLLDDLRCIGDSLMQHGGARIAHEALHDLRCRVRVFGFHLASLDIRQHRSRHVAALDELLAPVRLSELSDDEQMSVLTSALGESLHEGRGARAGSSAWSAETEEALKVFATIARMQDELGQEAVDTYIVSFTQGPADLLAILYLARTAGLFDAAAGRSRLRVVPLFETEDDLRRAPTIMARLYADPIYQRQLEAWGRDQQIMIGYSDSDKDAGYVASNWWLYRAQRELTDQARGFGVKLTFFHGRGGAIGRGGGPLHHAILGQPAGTVQGRLKVTEQGEVLFTRYANPGIAHRHLEQVVNAVVAHSRRSAGFAPAAEPANGAERPIPAAFETWEREMGAMAREAAAFYRELVSSPDFLLFFEEGTPLRSIMRLRIASRPAKRREGPLQLDDLRAIPWVFAWTQSRFGVPGWYGLGHALQCALEAGRSDELQAMYRSWPFFRWLIDAAQISLGKADLEIARRYATLAPDQTLRDKFLHLLADEFQRTVHAVNVVADQSRLLDSWPLLQRSIELRNPYVDPMSYLQVRCLTEVRRSEDEIERIELRTIIDRTVHGIAAGLQNTG